MSALRWRPDRVHMVAAEDSEVWTFGDAGLVASRLLDAGAERGKRGRLRCRQHRTGISAGGQPHTGAVERHHITPVGGYANFDPQGPVVVTSHLISDVVGVVPHVVQTGPVELRAFSAGINVAAIEDLVMLRLHQRARRADLPGLRCCPTRSNCSASSN